MKSKILLAIALWLAIVNPVFAKINYIETDDSKTSEVTQADAENIDSEQIIIQISQDGFVSSHGDHYHYYNGNVPYDSIFSEQLLVAENYQLNEKDIVTEIKDGYIVEVDDKLLLYFDDLAKVTSLRTDDEIMLQSKGVSPKDAANIVQLKQEYQSDVPVKMYIDQSESAVLAELNAKESLVIYLFDKGYASLIEQQIIVFDDQVTAAMTYSKSLVIDDHAEINESEELYALSVGKIINTEQGVKLLVSDKTAVKIK